MLVHSVRSEGVNIFLVMVWDMAELARPMLHIWWTRNRSHFCNIQVGVWREDAARQSALGTLRLLACIGRS